MISGTLGTLLKKNTKTRILWVKLGVAIILSNLFFFVLFGGNSEVKQAVTSGVPDGWVEVQLHAELMTPFHSGKKVLIIHRIGRKKLEGVLQTDSNEQLGKITVLVREEEAHALFQHETWEVLPYLKYMTFVVNKKEDSHEIRY
jgi:hypothetical protein